MQLIYNFDTICKLIAPAIKDRRGGTVAKNESRLVV